MVHSKFEKTVHIIELGVTGETSINATEWKKIQEYQDLKNAIKSEWNLERVDGVDTSDSWSQSLYN